MDSRLFNILLTIDSIDGGGAEVVVLRLASAFQELGHNVEILLFCKSIKHAVPEEVKLHILFPEHSSLKGLKTSIIQEKFNLYLKERIKSYSYDFVLSNLPAVDRVVAKVNHFNKYYCIHNSFYSSYVQRRSFFRFFLKKFRLKCFYSNKNLIFVSQGATEEMIDIIGARPKRHAVIHNPFPVEKIRQLSLGDHDAINFSYFLHVGRFNDQKRHDRLFSIFKRANVDSKLVLLGDGTEEQTKRVYDLINNYGLDEKVKLLGFRENPYPFIKNAKALLLTSDYEGLPTVIIESLICGTPVLSVNCPSGPEEIMGSQFPEYLFSASDEDGFASMICELDKSSRRIEFKNANRFDEELIARKYLDFCTVDVGD